MSTQTSFFGNLPTGQDIYDAIMGPIDKDLLSTNIDGLDKKYEAETESQRKSRMQRYVHAYKKYHDALEKFFQHMEGLINDRKKTLYSHQKIQDQTDMQSIEHTLTDI